jgi:hypothetical protein
VPDDVPLVAMVLCLSRSRSGCGALLRRPVSPRSHASGGRHRRSSPVGWLQGRIFGHGADVPNKTAYLYVSVWILSYVWLGRLLFDRAVTAAYRHGHFQRRVLAVGSADDAAAFLVRCGQAHSEIRVVGRLAFELTRTARGTVPSRSAPQDGRRSAM